MEPDEPCTSLTTTDSFTPSPAPLSAAAYRDKLLSGTLSGDEGVSDDNALVVISVGRLKGESTYFRMKNIIFGKGAKSVCVGAAEVARCVARRWSVVLAFKL